MSTGVFRRILNTAGLSKLDDRYAALWLEGIGRITADAQERTLRPAGVELSCTVLDWANFAPATLAYNLDKVEAAASEVFGPGRWEWHLDVGDYQSVCSTCCA